MKDAQAVESANQGTGTLSVLQSEIECRISLNGQWLLTDTFHFTSEGLLIDMKGMPTSDSSVKVLYSYQDNNNSSTQEQLSHRLMVDDSISTSIPHRKPFTTKIQH